MSKIALVTVTYNAADVWSPFLASVLAQQDIDWSLIVIDNASGDSTRTLLAGLKDPRITVVLNDGNVGVAAANNQGISLALEAAADRVVLINNDTEFGPDLMARLDRQMVATGADVISPLIPYHDRPDRIWYGGGSFVRLFGIMNKHDHSDALLSAVGDAPFQTDYAPTCCTMIDRSVFERIGLMDERYFVYWDDTDFMWRMKLAGLRLFVDPSAILLHKVSASTGGALSDFTIRYYFRNQMLFTRKFHGWAGTAYTAATSLAVGLARQIAKGERPRHFYLRVRALAEGIAMRTDDL